ncbi:hypothetical protein NDU88_008612 [Pleurodeles waltl]|uniref:Uncharacterized protein n=1 Tax=Pleurodeles waltl TaxID=8319 RepID=A0AAV7NWR4_PLEWA|nr:hypothetical protein NDU88_008612 [Pleurodeles waltl]
MAGYTRLMFMVYFAKAGALRGGFVYEKNFRISGGVLLAHKILAAGTLISQAIRETPCPEPETLETSSCIQAKPRLEIRLASPTSARFRVEAERSSAPHRSACCPDPGIECRRGGAAVAASIRPVSWSPGASEARVRGLGAQQEHRRSSL